MGDARQRADWYFDVISPFSYFQLQRLGPFRERLDLRPRPVLLGAVLKHWGQLGPAELPPKRLATYRMCVWTAQQRGLDFTMPERHPFNPISALRLLAALGPDWGHVGRAFDFIFAQGRVPDTVEGLQAFADAVEPGCDAEALVSDGAAKTRLRENTDEAIAGGVFGVPTLSFNGETFWGDDATDMALAFLDDPEMFRSGPMGRLTELPEGIQRRRD